MAIEHITTHAEDAPELLTEQYRNKPNMRAWLEVNGGRMQAIEDVLADMRTIRNIDVSIGVQLDAIGRIIGQDREGREDDVYRLWLKARVIVNRSSGLVEEFYAVASLLLTEEELRALDSVELTPDWHGTVTGLKDYIRSGEGESTGGSGELIVTGVLAGWTFTAPSAAGSPGTSGDGWLFDGVDDDDLRSTDAGLLALFEGTNPWSVVMRTLFVGTDFFQTFWNVEPDGSADLALRKNGSATYQIMRDTGGGPLTASDTTTGLSTDLRRTVGVAFTGSELQLFVDGELIDSVADATSMFSMLSFTIGATTGGGNRLDAYVYEMLFSDVAISAGEHRAIHLHLERDWPNSEATEGADDAPPGLRIANDGPSPENPLQIARILREVKSGGVPFRYSFAPPGMSPSFSVFRFAPGDWIVPNAGYGFDSGGRFADVLTGTEDPDAYPPGSWEYFDAEDAEEGSLTVRGRVRQMLMKNDDVVDHPVVLHGRYKGYLRSLDYDGATARAMRADALAPTLERDAFSVAFYGAPGSLGVGTSFAIFTEGASTVSVQITSTGQWRLVRNDGTGSVIFTGPIVTDEIDREYLITYDSGVATFWVGDTKTEDTDTHADLSGIERVWVGYGSGASTRWGRFAGIAFFDHALGDAEAIDVQRWMRRRFRGITPDAGPAQNLTPASIAVDDGPDWNPGDTLTVTPGTWLLAERVEGVWTRDANPIAGETGGTYVVQVGDIGTVISYEETAYVEGESDTVQVAITAETVVGTAVNTVLPVVTHDPPAAEWHVGESLTATPGTWTGADSVDGQWTRDGVLIAGATTLDYTIVAADAGADIEYRETAHVAGEPDVTADSTTGQVIAPHFATPPTLVNDTSGSFPAQSGDVLSVDISGILGQTSVAYQWLDTDGNPIAGADQATYTVDTGETGDGVSCLVTATNAGGDTPATTAEEAVTSGTWRDDYPTLEEDWPSINTTGDVIVSGALDQWVGRINGWVMAAASAPQRPTDPGGLGWRFNRPDSQYLESTDAGLLSLFSGSTPWSSVIRFNMETTSVVQYLCSQFGAAADVIQQQLGAGNNYNLRRNTSGGSTNISGVGPISGKHTLGFSFDGSFTYAHLDGSPIGTPAASSGAMAALVSDMLCALSGGVGSASGFFDAIIYERLMFSSALSDANMLAIHNSLATDYP